MAEMMRVFTIGMQILMRIMMDIIQLIKEMVLLMLSQVKALNGMIPMVMVTVIIRLLPISQMPVPVLLELQPKMYMVALMEMMMVGLMVEIGLLTTLSNGQIVTEMAMEIITYMTKIKISST